MCLILSSTDLSGLTLQTPPGRLVKDEYTAGGGMEVDGETSVQHTPQTIQHHPPQFPMITQQPTPQPTAAGKKGKVCISEPSFEI